MKTKLLTFFGALTVMAFVFVAMPNTASAQGADNNNDQAAQNTAAPENYSYTAQPGDSYSVLARKAVQTYGIDNKVDLSGAQIVFTETNLTQAAGSPVLIAGQKVEISKDTVKTWVDKAKALTAAQQTAWNYYVQFVNFNTNANGES